MYKVNTEIRKSDIDGMGVFSAENIREGTIIWQYTDGHDRKMTAEEFNNLDETIQESLKHVAYLSEQTGMWVIPPNNDPACFTNHSKNANTTPLFKPEISEEIVFIASRYIKAGDEITNNYLEFDPNADKKTQSWL